MLKIRQRNLLLIEEAIQKDLPNRLAKYVMEVNPVIYGNDQEGAKLLVEKACASAAQYGLKGERELRLYTDLMVLYGEDFHRQAWVADVLSSEELTSRQKIVEIDDRLFRSGLIF